MPRQNRVTPFGEIVATPERGLFMGNRGVLHDAEGRIRRAWQVKRWLVCVLEFRGRKRVVMKPNSYTELFFLDEATALAAGHRPCAECRHARFLVFCQAWKASHPEHGGAQRPTADEIDRCLHRERLTAHRSKGCYSTVLDGLPDGVFVTQQGRGERAYLVWGDRLLAWSPGGYGQPRSRPKGAQVCVLTPKSTVAAMRAGYVPEIHPSAKSRMTTAT
ncbi:MAG TPA: hypothetical protein VKU02_04925 [Gemmataceae bacterium]|nr:hypothetical protein [Gemmataceae bacterium]